MNENAVQPLGPSPSPTRLEKYGAIVGLVGGLVGLVGGVIGIIVFYYDVWPRLFSEASFLRDARPLVMAYRPNDNSLEFHFNVIATNRSLHEYNFQFIDANVSPEAAPTRGELFSGANFRCNNGRDSLPLVFSLPARLPSTLAISCTARTALTQGAFEREGRYRFTVRLQDTDRKTFSNLDFCFDLDEGEIKEFFHSKHKGVKPLINPNCN
jgi:hypothetical protein